jgi:transcriptional regulator with XRE-family HTH domain
MRIRFGENLRPLRAHADISQEELASRPDIHRTQITFFESGQRMPMLGTTLKLAAALEVELSTLLDDIVYRPRFFSTARGEFEISSRPLFEITDRRAGRRERGPGDRRRAAGPQPEEGEASGRMSQEELSRRSGVHHTETSLLERGGRIPRLDTVIKILEGTNADPRDLFDGVGWHGPARWDEKG